MEKTKKLEQILQKREALAESIHVNEQNDAVIDAYAAVIDVLRTYSCSQKELWQQVPYWALEAQWRGSHFYWVMNRPGEERFQRAYEETRWTIDERDGKSIFVDLTNGELLRRKPSTGYQFERAASSDILPLVKSGWFIDVLDAQNLLSFLKGKAKYPQRSWGSTSPEQVIVQREEIRKRYNIKNLSDS